MHETMQLVGQIATESQQVPLQKTMKIHVHKGELSKANNEGMYSK